ncbi:glycosyltransferase family 9 protein [Psychroserpens sp.]|uniref:glycosyltransferase family 9 protein n=1 Tax=Psychroserpens sp. TaxID=2020870 RepID=UPI002B266DEB|nr:glycosyltransferase family 9 protein [Psychroserpens sp.]
MFKISKLNPIKSKIFEFLTNSFKNSKRIPENLHEKPELKVLISRPNHRLGNQLLISPLIQEICNQYPNSKIDLVVNGGLSNILFSEYKNVNRIINLPKKPFNNLLKYITQSIKVISNNYDIAIAACEDSNSSKIFVKLSRATLKIYDSGSENLNKPIHIAKYPVYNFNTVLRPSVSLKTYEYPKLSINLTTQEIEKGKQIIDIFFKNDKKTICIFTFATRDKCYSKEWWADFYKKLKMEFSAFNILEILPMENVSQIDFECTSYYSKDLREIASVIENSIVFIGADSGMMHLAAATNTTTLGLFNVTNPKIYEPYSLKNEAIDTNTIEINSIINKIRNSVF